jgi:hypothetical protein
MSAHPPTLWGSPCGLHFQSRMWEPSLPGLRSRDDPGYAELPVAAIEGGRMPTVGELSMLYAARNLTGRPCLVSTTAPPPNVAIPTHFAKVILAAKPTAADVYELWTGAFVLPNAPIQDEVSLEGFVLPGESSGQDIGFIAEFIFILCMRAV